jgi:hypothetical protein
MGLFKRSRKQAVEICGLGTSLIARRLDDARAAPAGSVVVQQKGERELIYCFRPGPYQMDLTPFAAAPEIGLRLRFVIEANPRVSLQRFDLYLFSEAAEELSLADLGAAVQGALQHELVQGGLELPPCTSLDEWHAFRAGLNQLLYTRFGVTVDDCVPVDLGDSVDYAAALRARAAIRITVPAAADIAATAAPPRDDAAAGAAAATAGVASADIDTSPALASASLDGSGRPYVGAAPLSQAGVGHGRVALTAADLAADAKALRRLFLELPALTSGIRLLVLPAGIEVFKSHQAVLQRLSLVALSVNSMPSLEWRAPDQPLDSAQQRRRIAQSHAAAMALDEAWALLVHLQMHSPAPWPENADEADRILANLEYHLSERRLADAAQEEQPTERREPKL